MTTTMITKLPKTKVKEAVAVTPVQPMMGPKTAVVALTLGIALLPSPGALATVVMAMGPFLTLPIVEALLPLMAPMIVVWMKRRKQLPDPTVEVIAAMMTVIAAMPMIPAHPLMATLILLGVMNHLGMMAAVEMIWERRRTEERHQLPIPAIRPATTTAETNSTAIGAKSTPSLADGSAQTGWNVLAAPATPTGMGTAKATGTGAAASTRRRGGATTG